MECVGAEVSRLGGEISGKLEAPANLAPASKPAILSMMLDGTQRRSGHAGETNVLYPLGIERLAVRMYLLGTVACKNSTNEELVAG